MNTTSLTDNQTTPEARDFWTSRLSECPHERLREALKFQHPSRVSKAPETKRKGRDPRGVAGNAKIDIGNRTQAQVYLLLWKREMTTVVQTFTAFVTGFFSYLTGV